MSPELISRVRALRRRALAPAESEAPAEDALQRQVNDLRAQVAHLEQLVQGLQDSVYRDFRRHDERINEIQERIAPEAIAAALSKDERERGL
jgi:hypothetical protein